MKRIAKINKKRILAILTAVLMTVSVMAPVAFAREEAVPDPAEGQEEKTAQTAAAAPEPATAPKPAAARQTEAVQETEIYSVEVSVEIKGFLKEEKFRIEDADGEVTVDDAVEFATEDQSLKDVPKGWKYKVNGSEFVDTADKKVLRDNDKVYIYYEAKPIAAALGGEPPKVDKAALDNAYGNTSDMLTESAEKSGWTVGCEWVLLANARAGKINEAVKKKYCNSLISTLKKKRSAKNNAVLDKNQSSENAKAVIVLTAMGVDPTNVGGYNLLAPLGDMNYVKKQGMNGYVWALAAYNCMDSMTGAANNKPHSEALTNALLNVRRPDNGWAYGIFSAESDVDMTGMALQALAPFYKKAGYDNVTDAVDKALVWLKSQQSEDGSFGSVAMAGNVATSESASQVLTALTSLGIDPVGPDWTKNGKNAVDSLLSFYVKGGGFKHIKEHDRANGLASVQAHYAMVSLYRFIDGKAGLYDMSDVGDGYIINANYTKERPDNGKEPDGDAPAGKTAALGSSKGLGLIKLNGAAEEMSDDAADKKVAPTGYTRRLIEDDSTANWLPWAVGGAAALIAVSGLIAARRRKAA
ncbi:MAG: hypothetical protein ACOX4R_07695 [Lentihominibacter sp.]|jgi:hypothetical protein